MIAARPELALDARAHLGEGPCWSVQEQQLYWVDIFSGSVHAFAPGTGRERTWRLQTMPGCVVTRRGGGLLLGDNLGFASLDQASGTVERWGNPEASHPANRINDGKVDARGRLWAGAKSAATPADGGFHRLDADRRTTRILDGVAVSNGLAWSADGSEFFYIDTMLESVRRFRCDLEHGTLHDPVTVVSMPNREFGWPDGMCIDAEGLLWVAHFGGGRLTRWDPKTGKLALTVRMPVDNATSCAFGGPRLDQLYITTARTGLTEAAMMSQVHAGGVFVLDVGPIGLPGNAFAG
jgi:sugar lactone lactonase YvrE